MASLSDFVVINHDITTPVSILCLFTSIHTRATHGEQFIYTIQLYIFFFNKIIKKKVL
jgi:hypothetical protein